MPTAMLWLSLVFAALQPLSVKPADQEVKALAPKGEVVRRYAALPGEDGTIYVLELAQTNAKDGERRAQTVWFVPGHSDPGVSSLMLLVAVDRARKVRWSREVLNMGTDASWEAVADADALYLRLIDRIGSFDRRSGAVRWVVGSDANVSSGNARRYLAWTATADTFVVDTVHRVDMDDARLRSKIELDMATGKRVYRTLPRPKVEPKPAYVYARRMVEYPGDRDSPGQPSDFDGLRIERTLLLWSKKTNEGIIVGPLEALLPEISALAASKKDVKWRYVVDLHGAVRGFTGRDRKGVLAGYQDPVAAGDEILFLPPGDLDESDDRIAALELAKQLGAVAVPGAGKTPERVELAAAPLFFFRTDCLYDRAKLGEDDIPNHLKMKWGPYVVHETAREAVR